MYYVVTCPIISLRSQLWECHFVYVQVVLHAPEYLETLYSNIPAHSPLMKECPSNTHRPMIFSISVSYNEHTGNLPVRPYLPFFIIITLPPHHPPPILSFGIKLFRPRLPFGTIDQLSFVSLDIGRRGYRSGFQAWSIILGY